MPFGIHVARSNVVKQYKAVLAADNHSKLDLYYTPRAETQEAIGRITANYLSDKMLRYGGKDVATQLGAVQHSADCLAAASPVAASKYIHQTCEKLKAGLNPESRLSVVLPPNVTHFQPPVVTNIVPNMPANVATNTMEFSARGPLNPQGASPLG